jgi:hypothetical protein
MEAMTELEDGARETEQLLLSAQSEAASLKLQLQARRWVVALCLRAVAVNCRQALSAGRQDMQERLAGSDAQLKRAAEDLNLEQERRRVSDEGGEAAVSVRVCHASDTQVWLLRLLRRTR